jgi:hypothetical protein
MSPRVLANFSAVAAFIFDFHLLLTSANVVAKLPLAHLNYFFALFHWVSAHSQKALCLE